MRLASTFILLGRDFFLPVVYKRAARSVVRLWFQFIESAISKGYLIDPPMLQLHEQLAALFAQPIKLD